VSMIILKSAQWELPMGLWRESSEHRRFASPWAARCTGGIK
jgi:hypothetical protein